MDGQSRIVRIDSQWTTIQCGKCNKCFKALTGEYKWQMGCIYCSHLIELPAKPEAAEVSPLADMMARVGVDAIQQDKKKVDPLA